MQRYDFFLMWHQSFFKILSLYATMPSMKPMPYAEFTPFESLLYTNSPNCALFSASFACSTIHSSE